MNKTERCLLRDLASRLAEVAARPEQAIKRELWMQHNSLQPVRPLILLFPEGSWNEILPASILQCEDEVARGIEYGLLLRLYYPEHFDDDTVIENEWVVSKVIRTSSWGLEAQHISSTEARGAWAFDPVIKEPADLKQLRVPEVTYDEAATEQLLTQTQDLLGDILEVKLKGIAHLSYHLMSHYTGLRGLQEVYMDMVEEPQMLHDAMAFLSHGYQEITRQYVEQNLLSLNNDSTYHNSGGNSYTRELPAAGFDPARVRLKDMWGSAEAQEMAPIGPAQHAEFVLPYERPLLEPFGLTGYGCCDDLSGKLDDVCALPHMRRISVSPFADVDVCAERLRGDFIFSWKPHPAHLVGQFNEAQIRHYIRHTLEVCQENGCVLEMILKDTHTCENHPERFDHWTRIAREELNAVWGPAGG